MWFRCRFYRGTWEGELEIPPCSHQRYPKNSKEFQRSHWNTIAWWNVVTWWKCSIILKYSACFCIFQHISAFFSKISQYVPWFPIFPIFSICFWYFLICFDIFWFYRKAMHGHAMALLLLGSTGRPRQGQGWGCPLGGEGDAGCQSARKLCWGGSGQPEFNSIRSFHGCWPSRPPRTTSTHIRSWKRQSCEDAASSFIASKLSPEPGPEGATTAATGRDTTRKSHIVETCNCRRIRRLAEDQAAKKH